MPNVMRSFRFFCAPPQSSSSVSRKLRRVHADERDDDVLINYPTAAIEVGAEGVRATVPPYVLRERFERTHDRVRLLTRFVD